MSNRILNGMANWVILNLWLDFFQQGNGPSVYMKAKMNTIQIYGERHCGTNWLDGLIRQTVVDADTLLRGGVASYAYGWKHRFPPLERIQKEDTSRIIFIVLVRNPYNWLEAMHRYPHHAPDHKGLPFIEFIRKEWRCVYDEDAGVHPGDSSYKKEILPERDPATGKRFANVIELRKAKAWALLELKPMVENYFFLRYEDLVLDPHARLSALNGRFGLELNGWPDINIDRSKAEPVKLDRTALSEINGQLDSRLEHMLGYQCRNV